MACGIGHATMPREISPALNLDADSYYNTLPQSVKRMVDEIRASKAAGQRRRPSARLVLKAPVPEPDWRPALLDKVAELVDENLTGRSDMCKQFAALLRRGLHVCGIQSRAMEGDAQYRREDGTWMTWSHAWVETSGGIIIDGNIDSLHENPVVGRGLDPAPYWGPRSDLPDDRRIPAGKRLNSTDENDPDVTSIWLPDLQSWIKGLQDQKLAR